MISLIHPSRGRAEMALNAYNYWMQRKGATEVEHILSIDHDDPQKEDYKRLFPNSTIIVASNNNCVEATNRAAAISEGDVLVYLSDDFDCPDKWDELILKHAPEKSEWCLWVDDTNQGKNTVLTIPIMSRGLYNSLGYLYNPLYESMWVDVDLWMVCKKRGVLVDLVDVLRFEHKHYSVGKSEYDATYQAHDNKQRHATGAAIYKRRQAQGFMTKGVIR